MPLMPSTEPWRAGSCGFGIMRLWGAVFRDYLESNALTAKDKHQQLRCTFPFAKAQGDSLHFGPFLLGEGNPFSRYNS